MKTSGKDQMTATQFEWPTHDIQRCWLPCCDKEVRLHVLYEEATHLHERTCKSCGRVWTFATDRSRLPEGDGWSTGASIKLGRPTVPAIDEVLRNRDEDGWLDAHNRREMQKLTEQIKAGAIESPARVLRLR
jgi:hypothetical protein